MAIEKILVIDDELIIRKSLEDMLRKKRYAVVSAPTIAEAERYLAKDRFDLVFTDIHLPDGSGTDLLERIVQLPQKPLTVMITAHASVESAVSCMRAGAFDYVIKPFSPSEIEMTLNKAEAFDHVLRVNQHLSLEASGDGEMIGESVPIQRVRDIIRKVAPKDTTVLIQGENGTGKELVAREVFRNSMRASAPFIKVNCAAVSETLMESEFFGHEKGSFTGATERREGRFELANGGTILLDEISEISPGLQAKLLRVLQEREFERVGGNKTLKVDVRVIATTNRNLLKSVEKGEFREDLYYRLNVLQIQVPPLRDRPEDIPILADGFLNLFKRKHGLHLSGFTDAAMAALRAHPWPGNVRELQNCIERATILTAEGQPIDVPELNLQPSSFRPSEKPVSSGESAHHEDDRASADQPQVGQAVSLAAIERRHILEVLEQAGGNRTKAAQILDINVRTLRNKLQEYRIESADGKDEGA